jgi:hypothetical protein
VHEAEALPEWQTSHAKLEAGKAKRKAGAAKAVATKEARLLAAIEAWTPTIFLSDDVTAEQLIDLALSAKSALVEERSRGRDHDFSLYPRSHFPDNLVRWAENYVRHELTDYESEFFALSGCSKNHDRVRDKVNAATHKRWPDLWLVATAIGEQPEPRKRTP